MLIRGFPATVCPWPVVLSTHVHSPFVSLWVNETSPESLAIVTWIPSGVLVIRIARHAHGFARIDWSRDFTRESSLQECTSRRFRMSKEVSLISKSVFPFGAGGSKSRLEEREDQGSWGRIEERLTQVSHRWLSGKLAIRSLCLRERCFSVQLWRGGGGWGSISTSCSASFRQISNSLRDRVRVNLQGGSKLGVFEQKAWVIFQGFDLGVIW